VLLAPVTADTISRYLLTGQPDPLWAAFGPGRFPAAGVRPRPPVTQAAAT
jgi:hypothetical protein